MKPTKFYMVWVNDPFNFTKDPSHYAPIRPFLCSHELSNLMDTGTCTYNDIEDNIFFSEEELVKDHGGILATGKPKPGDCFILEFDL